MSSTSNVQNLLVNLLRPTYRYDPATGAFTPSLSMSNVTELIAGRIQTGSLTVTDSAINTFLGSNSGINVSNAARNVGIGYNAMAGAVNASSNVAVGFNSLEGVSNSSCNVALGAGTDISDGATRSVLIGPNVTLGGGSNNILIGANLSRGLVNNQLQIGTLLYGDLSSGFIGVNTSAPRAAFDISGVTLFNNKVGFQVPNPQFSLDVAGTVYASERFFGSNGSAKEPLYSFKDISGTGMYVPADSVYPPGSFGISANGDPIAIFSQDRVQFLKDLDVSGLFSSGTVAFATFAVTNGSLQTPAMTFTTDLSTGLYRPGITNLADVSQQLGVAVGSREVIRLTSRGDVSLQQLLVRDISSSGAFVSSAISASNQIGGITFSNMDLCMSASGRILGSSTASNWIGGVTLSNTDLCMAPTGRILGAAMTSNSIGGITFFNSDLSMSATGLLLAPIVRNARIPTQFDISGGTISNSGTHIAGSFLGTATTSNQIGGVTLFNTDLSMSATGRILGAPTTSNSIGGITFSNSDLSMAATGLLLAPIVRNARTATQFDISGGTISNSGAHIATNFFGTASASNQIGGVTLFNLDLCMSATGRILGAPTTSNSIGGITFSNSDLSMAATGLLLAPIVRNARTATQFDISGGTISNSGLTRSSNFRGANGTVSGPTYSFVSDPSSGVFLSDLSTLHLVTGGVRRLTVFPTGDVSLGRLLVTDLSASGAILSAYSTANTIGGVTLANGVVTTPGGISTTNLVIPGYIRDAVVPVNLDINGGNISNSGTTTSARFRGAAGSATIPTMSFVTDSSTGLHLGAGGSYLAFDTSGLQRMCISGALVGIGTSAPMSLLDLSDGTLSLRRRVAVSDNRASLEVGGGYDSNLTAGLPALAFQSNAGGFRHFIRSRHAAVADSTSNGIDFFLNTGTTNTGSIAPGTNNAIGLSVTAQGVGIATIRPAYALDISGADANIQSGAGTGTLYLGGQTTGLYLQRDLTGNGYLRPLASDVSLFLGAKDSNTMTVGTTAVTVGTGISFQSSGTVRATTLNVASDISATGAIFSSFGSNNIGGVTLCNGYVVTTGTAQSSNLVVTGYLRDNVANPTLDIANGVVRALTFLGTAATSSNQIGGVTFSNMDLCMSAPGLLVAPVVRNARIPTQFDISGGTISNSGTHLASNFIGLAGASNQIGGVTFSNMDLCMSAPGLLVAPVVRNARIPTQFDISGGNISNLATTRSATFLGTAAASSNQIGGVTFSNMDLSMSATGRILAPIVRNALVPMLFDISEGNISNSATTRSATFLGTATTSNQIGGVTFFNSDLSMAVTGLLLAPIVRNARTATQFDISGGTISNAGTTRSANFLAVPGGPSRPGYAFTSDLSTGMDLGGTSYLAFETGGVQRMCISGGVVGIGTPVPISILDLSDGTLSLRRRARNSDNTASIEIGGGYDNVGTAATGTSAIAFQFYDGGYRHFLRSRHTPGADSNNSLDFFINSGLGDASSTAPGVNSVNAMSITGRGIGIGTSTPSSILDIRDASATVRVYDPSRNPGLELNRSGAVFGSTVFVDWRLQGTANGGNFQLLRGKSDGAGNGVSLHVDGTTGSNIGMGTVAPASTLDVSGTLRIGAGLGTGETTLNTAYLEIGGGLNTSNIGALPAIALQGRDDAGNFGYRHFIRSKHSGGTNTNCNAIQFYLNKVGTTTGSTAPGTGNILTMAITNMGRVGITTDAPQASLDVVADSATVRIQDTAFASPALEFNRGGGAFGTGSFADWKIQPLGQGGGALQIIRGAQPTLTPTPRLQRMVMSMDAVDGQIGIGRNPSSSIFLDVSGPVQIQRVMGAASLNFVRFADGGSLDVNDTAPALIGLGLQNAPGAGNTGSDFVINTYTNTGAQLLVPAFTLQRATGYVGILCNSPQYALDVNGTISASSNEYTVYVTNAGINNVSVPTGFTKAHVMLAGGGGGGAGSLGAVGGGGGGGAGFRVDQLITNPAQMTVTIGVGGSGTTGAGGSGGATTLTYTGLASGSMSAAGGAGGGAAAGGTGGAGGTGYYGGGGGGGGSTAGTSGGAGGGQITGTVTEVYGGAGVAAPSGTAGGNGGGGGGTVNNGGLGRTSIASIGGGGGGGGPAGGLGGNQGTSGTAGGPGCGGGGAGGYVTVNLSGGAGGGGYAIIKFLR